MMKTVLRIMMMGLFALGAGWAQANQTGDANAWKQFVGKTGPSGWRANVIQPDPHDEDEDPEHRPENLACTPFGGEKHLCDLS